jgi:hypothetical protein
MRSLYVRLYVRPFVSVIRFGGVQQGRTRKHTFHAALSLL